MITNPSIWGALRDAGNNKVFLLVNNGAPLSGITGTGTGVGVAGFGCLCMDRTNGVLYMNEGDATTPYWTPTSWYQRGLLSAWTDFRDGAGKALADTAASAVLVGSGVRVFGAGIDQTDSGLVVTYDENGALATATTSAATNKLVTLSCLSSNASAGPYQPDTNGVMTVDAVVAMSSALTLRRFFIGFIGTAADALVSPCTGSTTTITLVQDDLAGLFFDVGLTAATELFAPHNKSDEAATIATTATGVDTGTVFPAAGTYVRLRVQVSAAGVMTCFRDKVQVTQISAALDVDEEAFPALLISSTSSAVKSMLVKSFAAWATRSGS